jgi:hypothetical protein
MVANRIKTELRHTGVLASRKPSAAAVAPMFSVSPGAESL